VLNDWRTPVDAACRALGDAGRWLRQFHRAGGVGYGHIAIDERLAQLREEFAESGLDLPDGSVVARAMAFLEETAGEVALIRLRRSWLHGDFKAENLVLSHGRVHGVDIDVANDVECLHDIVNFLFHIDVNHFRPQRWQYWFVHRVLRKAFLDGYADGTAQGDARAIDQILPPLALDWLMLHRILRGWAEGGSTGRGALRSRWDRFFCRVLLRDVLGRAIAGRARQRAGQGQEAATAP